MSQLQADKPAAEDIQSAFKVLEYIRDVWGYGNHVTETANNAHSYVQELNSDGEFQVGTGTEIQVQGVPQEAIDYAFDQFELDHLWELFKGYRDFPVTGEIRRDYDTGSISVTGLTIIEQMLVNSIDEKLASMVNEVEHNERSDYTVDELNQARKNLEFSIRRVATGGEQ